MTPQPLYIGDGHPRPETLQRLIDYTVDTDELYHAKDYLAGPDLQAAVTTALMLGMPLLLTGEPGSGKSCLAYSIARELGLEPLAFVVKSDTQARDLLYRFDAVARFHASQAQQSPANPRRFITFAALGRALLYAKPAEYAHGEAPGQLRLPPKPLDHPGLPRRSVVLIDEIDKAPRDVPNDLLTEIERMRFDLPELAGEGDDIPVVTLEGAECVRRPIVIITSNSERALPEAFLRRCVYHHLELPPFRADQPPAGQVTVEAICERRVGRRFVGSGLFTQALDLFRFLRRDAPGLARPPSLAELLGWLAVLVPPGLDAAPADLDDLEARAPGWFLDRTRDLLFKNQPDQARARDLIALWRQSPTQRTA